jgi:hypothetical protein
MRRIISFFGEQPILASIFKFFCQQQLLAHNWKITSSFDSINLFLSTFLVYGVAADGVAVAVVQKPKIHSSRSDIPPACWDSRPCVRRNSWSWCTCVCSTGKRNFWGKFCKSCFRQCWHCCPHMNRRPLLKIGKEKRSKC